MYFIFSLLFNGLYPKHCAHSIFYFLIQSPPLRQWSWASHPRHYYIRSCSLALVIPPTFTAIITPHTPPKWYVLFWILTLTNSSMQFFYVIVYTLTIFNLGKTLCFNCLRWTLRLQCWCCKNFWVWNFVSTLQSKYTFALY